LYGLGLLLRASIADTSFCKSITTADLFNSIHSCLLAFAFTLAKQISLDTDKLPRRVWPLRIHLHTSPFSCQVEGRGHLIHAYRFVPAVMRREALLVSEKGEALHFYCLLTKTKCFDNLFHSNQKHDTRTAPSIILPSRIHISTPFLALI
jgi:hypothetical protein